MKKSRRSSVGSQRRVSRDIRRSLERLERIRALPKDAFLADQDALDLACYRLLIAIEAAIHICFHICAQRLHRVPEEYAECFAILGEAGIVPPELNRNLQRMVRFRNMLVHLYWEIDYDRMYEILQGHPDDLRKFVRAIGELL
ncbi:type VII toxin-antitoxin system HepT family RNase toxin [Thermodesulforhabdus norvegica]|uniref:Uncharacterized conserved protein YutE, UPF0331/DUF86 family n=1 Tax=Thermodesulforhabdus norvegica TaxID=39841 RepID=A0A1I4TUE7_9BACT|nr:Uncharacterized conserved protein YutE, UPF0331/DUF86 family [Thermodesulforhabdus norvegica]